MSRTSDLKRMPRWEDMYPLKVIGTRQVHGKVPEAVLDAIPDLVNWARKSVFEIALFLGIPKKELMEEMKKHGILLRPKTITEAIITKK
jgi:hypothetical protein